MLLHLQEEVGDCVFTVEEGRPAAELLAAIWYTFKRKYKKSIPVTVTSEIKFHRDGVPSGTLQTRGGQNPGFNKLGPQQAALKWEKLLTL